MSAEKPGGWLEILAWVSVGVVLGLGVYTFQYAEGLSYLSNNPKACVNCHVMRNNYRAWQQGPHHAAATCNDCHVPHSFPAKWLAKAENGWNHSVKFTLGNYKTPIQIHPENLARVQDNCIRCHGEQIGRMPEHPVKVSDISADTRCTDCHTAIGHAEKGS